MVLKETQRIAKIGKGPQEGVLTSLIKKSGTVCSVTSEGLEHLYRSLVFLRRFSVAFRALWNFHNDPKGF